MTGSRSGEECGGPGVVAIIPARFAATRFPGKVLAELHGRTLLEWVHRRAVQIRGVDQVWVATDDDRIEEAARAFGASVARTRSDHVSGTDRIGEVLATLEPRPAFVLNLQGDEPLLPVQAVERILRDRGEHPGAIFTLVEPVGGEDWQRPSVVKAVVSRDGRVLYFSRVAIPYPRNEEVGTRVRWRHVGIYGYPSDVLARIVSLPPSPLEQTEGLEQLRWMEAGIPVYASETTAGSPGVDVPEDLERLREIYPTVAAWEAAG